MRKTLNIILTAILMMTVLLPASAQDSRQRTPETIVGDVLAQMPIQKQADFNREMEDLAKAAPRSIQMLAQMLQPAEKATNNKVEYAISGVVAFASTNKQYAKAVRDGLQMAAPRAADQTARQFLQEQMRLLGEGELMPEYTTHEGAKTYTAAYDKLVALGEQAGTQIVKTLKTKDHALRMQALKFATDHNLVNDLLVKSVAAKYNSCSTEGKVDIINWLGDNKVSGQKALLMKALKKGGAPATAALEALGRIGGDDALEALISQLGTENNDAAYTALRSYKSDISAQVAAALQTATGAQQASLLSLANDRRIKAASEKVFELVGTNADALKALPGVVASKDAAKVAGLLDKAEASQIADYQSAFAACLKAQDAKTQYETISAQMSKASNKDRFYPALASTNTNEAVADLQKIWQDSKNAKALSALKTCKNYKAAAPLLSAAKDGDESALKSYVSLVNANEANVDNRFGRLEQALKIAKSADAKKNIITSLGQTPTRSSFILVGQYLDDKDVAYTAATAEKAIVSKSVDDIEYDLVNTNMTKAIELYKAHGSADDGYAVDEIKKMLAETKPSPVYVLSDEEKAQGFELLFDGTNLDNFTGNKTNYVPINGNIYVTADYGSGGNLYTVKEYRDFVFRFEFCFMRPGVNNGIGIRTPMGVDAAYEGMCECQILDHDNDIYKGWLREYQVHGSVYGVIPAKRIKHKPIGEWSTEEIRVQGDHITVTVNGEVITDGDIREACQGHNVAPDGSDTNPFTVDHRNHPGMFNKTGHIGFLGHGTGIKFRNVRVLDLSNQPKTKKGKKK